LTISHFEMDPGIWDVERVDNRSTSQIPVHFMLNATLSSQILEGHP
jgi:hypothetical protein